MSTHTVLYNAFTGLNAREKSAVISFIRHNVREAEPQQITDAIDYAVKLIPSFGGFVLAAKDDEEIVAAVVANRTGMDGYGAKHLLVYAVHKRRNKSAQSTLEQLLRSAVDYAGGEISLRVDANSNRLAFYEHLGFKARYVELQLDKARLPVQS